MVSVSTLFQDFLKERRFLKNVTPKTLSWYESSFLAFTRTVTAPSPEDITKSLLQRFVVGLREQGLEPVSCNTYVKAINAFLVGLHAEGHIDGELNISLQRTERKVVAILKEQVGRNPDSSSSPPTATTSFLGDQYARHSEIADPLRSELGWALNELWRSARAKVSVRRSIRLGRWRCGA